jgi:hypothetical protein
MALQELEVGGTTDTQIIRVVEALYNLRPGYTYFSNFGSYVAENSIDELANALANNFAESTDAELAETVSVNLGITGELLELAKTYFEAQFAANPGARGKVILDTVDLLAGLEADETWGAVATSFNADVDTSLIYSQTAGNTEVTISDPDNPVVVPGNAFELTANVVDTLIGTSGNDTFTGDATTYADADQVTDVTTTDNDTYNLTVTTAAAPQSTNVENINVTMNSVSAIALDAASITNASNLTVTREDLTIGGTSVTGNKAVRVDNADSANITTITAGAATATLDVNSAGTDEAGLVIDADVATTDVTVDGAATINAAVATGTVAVDAVNNTTAAETVKATTINAAAAGTVTTHADLTGAITINAAAATVVTVNDAQGGANIVAGDAATADVTITVVDVDASGVSITTGTGSSVAAEKEISIVLDGTPLATDAATISAAGTIALDIDGTNAGNVDVLTLSGSNAAVTYNLAAPTTGTFSSLTKAGTESVTVAGDLSEFGGTTIDGVDVVTVNAIAGGAAALDMSSWTNVGNVNLAVDNANSALTVANGAKVTLTSATQTTGLDFDFSAASTSGDLTVVSGDVNGVANTAVGTATVNAFNAAAGATVVGDVTLEAFESNFTASATVLGARQNLVITGDENVTLGAVTADSVSASASTGIIDLTAAANVDTVTTGSGADVVVLNGSSKHTVATGSGNDDVTITDTSAETSVDAGEGNDTVNANDNDVVYVVNGGAGDDTLNVGFVAATGDLDAYFVGGSGTDTLAFTAAGANDVSGDEFSFSGIQKLDLTALNDTLTISDTQFAANNTLELVAAGSDDVFAVNGSVTTSAATIDASNLTIGTGSAVSSIQYTGSVAADTITGGVAAETFIQTLGADSMDGGATGVNTYQLSATGLTETGSTNAATGYVVNLGGSALSGTAVFAGISKYLGDSATSVAAGTVAYTYDDADSSTVNNSAVVDSVSNITSVTGSNLADYIVASASGSTITAGTGADYVVLGDSADTVVHAIVDVDTTAGAVTDTITGFTSGSDTISLGNAGSAANYLEAGAAVADLATLLTAAGTGLDGTVTYYVGQVTGGSTYLVTDVDGTGYSDVFELVGVALTGIAQADIVA